MVNIYHFMKNIANDSAEAYDEISEMHRTARTNEFAITILKLSHSNSIYAKYSAPVHKYIFIINQ